MPILRVAPAGLWTDPNPFGSVPPGALSVASDIVIRRKGVAEQRPGFKPNTSISPGAGYNQAFRLITFGQDTIVICNDQGTSNEKAFWLSTGLEILAGPLAEAFSAEYGRGFSARGRESLYVGGDTYTYKLTSYADVQADAAGMPRAHSIRAALAASGGSMLGALSEVAYRVIWRKRDANGNILRSTPSPRFVMRNGTGAADDVTVYISIPYEIAAGDVAEVYRSDAVLFAVTSPDDELGLVKEYTIVAGDITSRYFSFIDTLPNDQRGAIYYAAPSREGIQNSNERPPLAKDLASFGDSLFFANVGNFEQLPLTLLDVAGTGDASGFGYRSTTSSDLTGTVSTFTVASATGIVTGMAVSEGTTLPSEGNAYIGADTIVTNVSGTTITVSPAISSSPPAGARTVRFHDRITITTSADASPAYFYAADGYSALYTGSTSRSFPVMSLFAAAFDRLNIRDTALALAHAIDSFVISTKLHVPNVIRTSSDDPESAQGDMVLRARWPGTAFAFTFNSTHATAFSIGNNGRVSSGSAPLSSADEGQNILYWSKFNEPEAVPIVNFAPVGAADDPILRIIPLTDALYIFKLSGEVYRLTGAGATAGWRIDLANASCRLLSWNCVDVLNDRIVVWSEQGVGFFSENGLLRFDLPIRNITEPFARAYSANATTSFGPTNGAIPYVFCNDRVNEVIIAIPSTAGVNEACTPVYVWNANTDAWVMWDRTSRAMGVKASGALLFSDGADGASTFTLYEERITPMPPLDTGDRYDEQYSVTLSAVSPNDSTLITVTGGSGWLPIAGDNVTQSSLKYMVVKVVDTTHFYVHKAGLTAAAATARVGINGMMTFRALAAASPAVLSEWTTRTDEMLAFVDACRVTVDCTSDWSDSPNTQTLGFAEFGSDIVTPLRSTIPRACSVATIINPRIAIRQAESRWLYAGFAVHVAPIGTDSRRDLEVVSTTTGAVIVVGGG